MTPKQKRFVEEYLVDLNAAAAARRAGYAKGSAWRLMRHREVGAAIEEAQETRAQRTRVSADRVVTEIAKVAFGDPRRLFSWGPGGVELRESSELTEAEAALVSEVSETRTSAGGTRRVKLHCKMTALTALGKHLGLFGNGRKAALLRAAAENGGTDNGEVEQSESGRADDARERLARRIAGLAARLGTRDPDRGAE
ncbi:MAG: terminase small subunit [Proteobacteria bacterium]|nr:terminase small subunit [Pseudomonadota bacterium]